MSQPYAKQQEVLKPDHGENFVPGSERAPENLAPQPLDHFKRGYRERADLRDRETNQLSTDFDAQKERTFTQQPQQQPQQQQPHQQQPQQQLPQQQPQPPPPPPPPAPPAYRSNEGPRSRYRGAGGFDPVRLVDVLCRPGCNLMEVLDCAKEEYFTSFASGKALTAILSNLARRRKMGIALSVWQWMDQRGIEKNVYHYNSLISVCEKTKDHQRALMLLREMESRRIQKNEVTFSSAISACEKAGKWRVALDLLDRMKTEGVGRTAIAYNAAISACEKGLVPHKALELFEQMKREGVTPTVITYSALISAAEKGQQWKLALEVLEEMKASGHGANVIAYSAAISALSKGQMWEKALELFREIERSGNTPSIVTYNATMTALEKGLQWERALDLFDEMKMKRLPITVVSYGSAISACEKGLQYRQCLEYLDEMTELGIKKNVIIFGAAMSCMEKCCRADIAFQLMDRMKMEGVAPNVHIYNSAISACARCNLWEKGLELFEEMDKIGVVKDVVSYNAVLDAVCSQVALGRRLFQEGVERGFYARVSRLGTQWLELDLHFLSLGGGEIALGWWFEECLVPYLVNTSKLAAVKSIDIVTGYGKTRMRGVRHGDDGMRKRVRAMLSFMNIVEVEQPNKGRIHIDKEALTKEVERNGGKIIFDEEGYGQYKSENTTANHIPNVDQKVRPRYSAEHFRDVPLGDNARPSRPRDFRREGSHGYQPYDSRDRRGSRRRSSDSSYFGDSGPRDHQRRDSSNGRYRNGYDRRSSYHSHSRDDRRYSFSRRSSSFRESGDEGSHYGESQSDHFSRRESSRYGDHYGQGESGYSQNDYSHSEPNSQSRLHRRGSHFSEDASVESHQPNGDGSQNGAQYDARYRGEVNGGNSQSDYHSRNGRSDERYGSASNAVKKETNELHDSDRFKPARKDDAGLRRSWSRQDSKDDRRTRSRSRDREPDGTGPEAKRYRRQDSSSEKLGASTDQSNGDAENSANHGDNSQDSDRPPPKKRGYDLQQSKRASISGKRGY